MKGVAKVESTTESAPTDAARRDTAAMSTTFMSGLVGVSTQIIFGAGVAWSAAATTSRLRRSTASVSIPYRLQTWAASRQVPP